MLAISADAILHADEHGAIVYANPSAEKLFGYAAGELVGELLANLLPERHRGRHEALMRSFARQPVEADGTEHVVQVPVGTSLMQAAVDHAIPGIEGDCGGMCACGMCHVYVPDEHRAMAGFADELESAMLEFAFGVDECSRLSCQIKAAESMDGMRVLMPERQY